MPGLFTIHELALSIQADRRREAEVAALVRLAREGRPSMGHGARVSIGRLVGWVAGQTSRPAPAVATSDASLGAGQPRVTDPAS
jgi:hypothetical protein